MQKTINPIFSIIIPTFNGQEFIALCLSGVLKSNFTKYEVLVYDDSSSDDSFRLLRKYSAQDDRIHIHRNVHNIGAAATRNLAAKKACGEILVFLDIDTIPDPNWLDELLNTFLKYPDAAAVQCTVLDMRRRNLIQHAGGLLMRETAWLIPLSQWDVYNKHVSAGFIVAVSCALAVKKNSFQQVRGFDQQEAIHSEDVDFSWRLWLLGKRIYSCPQSVVYHWQKSLSQRANMQATLTSIYYHLAKNSLRSMIKNYSTVNLILYFPILIAILIFRALVFIISGKGTSAFIGLVRALKWNFSVWRDTLSERKLVQNTRLLTDQSLFDLIFINDNLLVTIKKYFL